MKYYRCNNCGMVCTHNGLEDYHVKDVNYDLDVDGVIEEHLDYHYKGCPNCGEDVQDMEEITEEEYYEEI